MRIARKLESEALVPTASMADIAFLLIVFFMLTFKVIPDKTKAVLPETVLREDIQVINEAVWVGITKNLAEEGQIHWTCKMCPDERTMEAVSLEDMGSLTRNALTDRGAEQVFVLKSDKDVKYEFIDLVIDTLRTNKAKTVILLTEQKTVGG